MFTKIISILALVVLLLSHTTVFAISIEELDRQLKEKNEEITKLEAQLDGAKEQEKTLKSQLDFIDGQTKLTRLKIEQTNTQIAKLEAEITDLSTRIIRLSSTVDTISEVLLTRIIQTYKYGDFTPVELFFSSQGFSDLLSKIKYIQVVQANDKKVLYQLQATKATYNDQKVDRQTRQEQQEKLKKDLEKYQDQLEQQKKAKEELLKITQNDEKRFQSLIARLRADTESIRRALAGGGVKKGPVNRGDIIAVVGNSGCSTGPHLHFEVMTDAKVENNSVTGRENKVDPKPFLDSGKFEKPLASYNGAECDSSCRVGNITTKFGDFYFLGQHKGLDVADYAGTPIRAAEKGIAYEFSDSSACYLTGTVGKGMVIDHENGYVTLYWHIP